MVYTGGTAGGKKSKKVISLPMNEDANNALNSISRILEVNEKSLAFVRGLKIAIDDFLEENDTIKLPNNNNNTED